MAPLAPPTTSSAEQAAENPGNPAATRSAGRNKVQALVIAGAVLVVLLGGTGAYFWQSQEAKIEEVRLAQDRMKKEAEEKAKADAVATAEQRLRLEMEDKRTLAATQELQAKQRQVEELAEQLAQAKSNPESKQAEGVKAATPGLTGQALTVAKIYHSLPLVQSTPQVNAMLKAMAGNNEPGYTAAGREIELLQKPPRGPRKQARALNDEGLLLLQRNEWAQAADVFMRAAELDPLDREIAGNLGFAYDKLGRLDEAKAAHVVALTIAPMQTAGWGGLGLALAKSGRVEDAVAAFRLAYRFSKNQEKTAEYFRNLAENGADSREKEAAAQALPFMTPKQAN